MKNLKFLFVFVVISLHINIAQSYFLAAGVIPYTKKNNTYYCLLGFGLRQTNHGYKEYSWCDFGGGGSDPLTTAAKEFYEETLGFFQNQDLIDRHKQEYSPKRGKKSDTIQKIEQQLKKSWYLNGYKYRLYFCEVEYHEAENINTVLNNYKKKPHRNASSYLELKQFAWIKFEDLINVVESDQSAKQMGKSVITIDSLPNVSNNLINLKNKRYTQQKTIYYKLIETLRSENPQTLKKIFEKIQNNLQPLPRQNSWLQWAYKTLYELFYSKSNYNNAA